MENELTDDEFEYYSRQLALSDIGYNGQLMLKNSKACILGCGGLGVPTMLMLTAMGIGHLKIIDRDIISKSDLHRQYLYDYESIGQAKAEIAAKKLRKLNPNIKIEPLAEPIIDRNVAGIIRGMDIAVDALDSMETRYLVNRTCHAQKIPYVFAGAIESIANASTIIPGKTPCLECVFPGFTDNMLPKCSLVGVHTAIINLISNIQVSETISILTKKTPKLAGKLLLVSLSDLSFEKVDISKQENCPICGSKPQNIPQGISTKYFEEECARDGRRTFILTPKINIEIDLTEVAQQLHKENVKIQSIGELAISFEHSGFNLSLLKSGTMIAQVTSTKSKEELSRELHSLYSRVILDWLRLNPEIIPSV